MRSTFNVLFYINRNKIKADGTTAILCRISVDGKKTVITTGHYCRAEEWNSKKGELKTDRANQEIKLLDERIKQTYDTILKEHGIVSAELLKNTLLGVNTAPTFLLQAGEVERERLRLRSLEIDSTSSYRQSKYHQASLHEYILSLEKKDISFSDITEEFGENYKLHLKSKDYSPGHINHCLTWLNRLVYTAVDNEIIRYNPLADVSYEKKVRPNCNISAGMN